jgi:hypothetical protein
VKYPRFYGNTRFLDRLARAAAPQDELRQPNEPGNLFQSAERPGTVVCVDGLARRLPAVAYAHLSQLQGGRWVRQSFHLWRDYRGPIQKLLMSTGWRS